MRFALLGSISRPEPLFLKLNDGEPFSPEGYLEAGYNTFDVICIGAAGGTGGGINTANTGTLVRNYGGAGGGGGLHRVRGLLSALPSSCPVVVGVGGVEGLEHVSDSALTTHGQDGGYSSFNDTTCRASGGTGGRRAQSNSLTVGTQADGGQGGLGNRILAGGGALGGIAGVPTATGPGTPGSAGADGGWNGTIGTGGGGGAGGVGKFGGAVTANAATAGGRGSYDPSDLSVFGPGLPAAIDSGSGALVVPGGAAGAKATPINGLTTIYGRSVSRVGPGDAGLVVIRLTAE